MFIATTARKEFESQMSACRPTGRSPRGREDYRYFVPTGLNPPEGSTSEQALIIPGQLIELGFEHRSRIDVPMYFT